jgi:hypothetical protein
MSSIIYETINLYNKQNNINPYRYIGSDQNNNPNYYGTSKKLKDDINKLGKEHFEKNILCEFKYDIPNILLRKIEGIIQKKLNCSKNETYYNKTNSSWSGYSETDDEKKQRIEKTHLKRKEWWDNLNDNERVKYNNESSKHLIEWNNFTKGKTFEEIYGEEKGKEKRLKHCGSNNGRSKKILDIKTGKIFNTIKEAMNFYQVKKYETIRKKCIKEKEMKFL